MRGDAHNPEVAGSSPAPATKNIWGRRRKVAWIWDPDSRPRSVPALVSFFIEGHRRGSQVTVVHAGFWAAPSRQRVLRDYRQGWEDCLAKLKLYLEAGKTCKRDRLTLDDVDLLRRRAVR